MPSMTLPRLTLSLFLATLIACGTRTGLSVADAASPRDARSLDARARDAFAPDARACVRDDDCDDGIECTVERCQSGRCDITPLDSVCDDGLFCDGTEQCVPGVGCTAVPPDCGDSVGCTVDRCDEAARACSHEPDVSLCPVSHRCDVDTGCTARALAHDPTTLYEIDLPSGALHVLGESSRSLTDIALHPDGTLYGASFGELLRVDYVLGSAEAIMDVDGQFNALDIAPDGTLYGATSDRVVRFDLDARLVVPAAMLPRGHHSSGDLAFVGATLFATTAEDVGGFTDFLVRIDLVRGVSVLVGPLGHDCVWGLAPFADALYGLTCDGLLLSIDRNTGAATVLARGTTLFYGAGAR